MNYIAKQSGASLIEVMVAVIIMSIGLLGLAAMQTTAMKNNQSAMQRTQASLLAYEFIDLMRANNSPDSFKAFISSTYSYSPPDPNNCFTTTGCDVAAGDDMPSNDLYYWKLNLEHKLSPSAKAMVCDGHISKDDFIAPQDPFVDCDTPCVSGTSIIKCTLVIRWIDDRSKTVAEGQDATFYSTFSLSTL